MSLKLGLRNKIRRSRSAGAGFTGLLDQSFASGATAAYSLRQLKATATKAVRVREDSGNTETDIGFSGAVLDETALLNHCGSANGFVSKWYDQSGNSNDASNLNNASGQPKIFDSSNGVIKENGRPAIKFDGADDFLQSLFSKIYFQPISIIDVFRLEQGNAVQRDGNSSNGQRITITTADDFKMFAGGSITGASIDQNQHLFFCLYNSSNSEFYQDGGIQVSGNVGSNNIGGLTIGAGPNGSNFFSDMKYQELILYAEDRSTNRTNIETNINNHYSIF